MIMASNDVGLVGLKTYYNRYDIVGLMEAGWYYALEQTVRGWHHEGSCGPFPSRRKALFAGIRKKRVWEMVSDGRL